MRELTMNDLTMRDLTALEIGQVSGGAYSSFVTALTVAGALCAAAAIIVGLTMTAPIWLVIAGGLGIAGVELGAYAYAAQVLTDYQVSTPHGTVTIEELTPTEQAQTMAASMGVDLGNVGDLTDAINMSVGDMPEITIDVDDEYGEGGS